MRSSKISEIGGGSGMSRGVRRATGKKAPSAPAKSTSPVTNSWLAKPKSTGSVTVVKGNSGPNKNYDEMLRKGFNKDATNTAMRRRSGELARTRASQVDVGKPKTTVKINSAIKSAPRASRTRSGNKAK